ncbi:hypothetical protein M011DRAFT_292305 [Sporormia fimetaria CBS 119925]|uniref:Uncharacterized protein n=1 Tax=Sporormia fimetaria CBS 119925 TaxID=1340428 RepID=A0A6A6UXY0_9PLEO|nr:hypothetical protein M011DRAFT_292305 [Sporormia fimetaria CBS 119925]
MRKCWIQAYSPYRHANRCYVIVLAPSINYAMPNAYILEYYSHVGHREVTALTTKLIRCAYYGNPETLSSHTSLKNVPRYTYARVRAIEAITVSGDGNSRCIPSLYKGLPRILNPYTEWRGSTAHFPISCWLREPREATQPQTISNARTLTCTLGQSMTPSRLAGPDSPDVMHLEQWQDLSR